MIKIHLQVNITINYITFFLTVAVDRIVTFILTYKINYGPQVTYKIKNAAIKLNY
jgi:hypothetical protein